MDSNARPELNNFTFCGLVSLSFDEAFPTLSPEQIEELRSQFAHVEPRSFEVKMVDAENGVIVLEAK